MKEYRKAKKHTEISVGDSLRIIRELQELSQHNKHSAERNCLHSNRIV